MSTLITDEEERARKHAATTAGLSVEWARRFGVLTDYPDTITGGNEQDTSDDEDRVFAPFENLGAVPDPRGEKRAFGGYAANVDKGTLWSSTTAQLAGLYPFAAPAGSKVRGVPFGRHLYTAEPIGMDPAQWLVDGLVTNTGIWVQGQPGVGKSAAIKRLLTLLVAFGFVANIPGDIKDEYTALVEELGGKAFRIGRGLHTLNPLDLGPLRGVIDAATGTHKMQLLSLGRARRLDLLDALLTLVGRSDLAATERLLLAMAFDMAEGEAVAKGLAPTIPDVLRILESADQRLIDVLVCDTDREYLRETREFRASLQLLCQGPIAGLFDGQSTFEIPPNTPALSLSLAQLKDDSDDVVGAAMLCSWAWGTAIAEGHKAQGRRRNIFQPQDEMWRALRAAPGLVEKSDRMTRLNRHEGFVTAQSTHTQTDLHSLPTEADRAKAVAMAARNDIKILAGTDNAEIDRLSAITQFSSRERSLLTSWQAPPTLMPNQDHPGRGKYLIKSGNRIGLPVEIKLSPTEKRLYYTDDAMSATTTAAH